MNITELNGATLNAMGGAPSPPSQTAPFRKTVRASSGIAIVGAEVTVLTPEGNSPLLWSASANDEGELLEQPLLTDSSGAFQFYVEYGRYNVTIQFGAEVVELKDQIAGPDKAYVDGRSLNDFNWASLPNFPDPGTAASSGVPVGGLYRTGGDIKVLAP